MKVGDLAFFYHSSSTSKDQPNGIYGLAKVASRPYGDPSALDPKHEHFDPRSLELKKKAEKEKIEFKPVWVLVDFLFVKKYKKPLPLAQIKNDPVLSGIMVAQKGSRLSIQPVSEKHFKHISSCID